MLRLRTAAAVGAIGAIGATCAHRRVAHAAQKPINEDNKYWESLNQGPSGSKKGTAAGLATGFVFMAGAGALFFALSRYKRCPSNQILVLQGAMVKKGSICYHGGGAVVLPVFQEYGYLSLEPLQIETHLHGALSLENIRVNIPSVFTVAISTDPELMPLAAQRLLGLNRDEIGHQAKDIIFGQMRQVVASMNIIDINRSREKFVEHVQANIEHELSKLGLALINVNITDITDDAGFLEALGAKAAQEAIQRANVEVAEQEKLGAVGTTENKKDAALRIAEMRREQQVGEAEARFAEQRQVKVHERETRINIANADAEAVRGENSSQEAVAESNSRLAIKQAEAYRLSEIASREAEAAVVFAAARAERLAQDEVAKRVEAERRAELEAPARAEKAKAIVDAEAAAERIRIQAAGQAEATFATLDAQARGEYALLKAKADGLREIVAACGSSQAAFQLLMLDHVEPLARESAKAISNIKFDKVVVWDGGKGSSSAGSGNATADFIRGITTSVPPSLQILKDVAGVEMPDILGKFMEDTKAKSRDLDVSAPIIDSSATNNARPRAQH